jgi:hypothetical protein
LLARGIQKLKTIRHPNFLKFYEGGDTETEAFYITESCIPLSELIIPDTDSEGGEKKKEGSVNSQNISQCELIWGLYRIIVCTFHHVENYILFSQRWNFWPIRTYIF